MSIKKEDGFTLVELMITMVVFVLAMVAASNIFTGILNQFKQQSSIAGSNIEGIGGLEILRHDVEQAGFGLPWNLNGATYNEAATTSVALYDADNTTPAIAAISASLHNDSTGNAPRAVVVGNNVLMNGSDVLVIKATNIATNAASQKWEYIVNNGALPNEIGGGSTAEQLKTTDYAIIINPSTGSNVGNQRVLMNSGGFGVQLGNDNFSFKSHSTTTANTPFEPTSSSFTAYIAYGISETAPRMPFNRADFYIKVPAVAADMPSRCASGTGVLYKATINHADGGLTELPLLDCVADMQVVLARDSNGSGGSANDWVGLPADGSVLLSTLTAQDLRNQLKEIRIYLIVQEGQKDSSYTYVRDPANPTVDSNMVYVIDPNIGNVYGTTPHGFTIPAANLNYRWKLHTIVITPYNL